MKLLLLFILSPLFLLSQVQIGDDIDGLLAGNNSGYAISVSADGSIVAIGSPSYDNIQIGHVRVFKNKLGVWTQIGDDIIGESAGDHFGSSVSLSSDGSIISI